MSAEFSPTCQPPPARSEMLRDRGERHEQRKCYNKVWTSVFARCVVWCARVCVAITERVLRMLVGLNVVCVCAPVENDTSATHGQSRAYRGTMHRPCAVVDVWKRRNNCVVCIVVICS